MNERIENLIEQTRIQEHCHGHWSGDDPQYLVDLTDVYELVQKVVAECASICDEMAAKCAGLPGDGALAKDCANWIRKDFGEEQ